MEDESVIICRCEEITERQIQQTVQAYGCSAREVKLRTRAGMGYCGGRTCRHMIDKIVNALNEGGNIETIPLRYRPPVRPITFGLLGKRAEGEEM